MELWIDVALRFHDSSPMSWAKIQIMIINTFINSKFTSWFRELALRRWTLRHLWKTFLAASHSHPPLYLWWDLLFLQVDFWTRRHWRFCVRQFFTRWWVQKRACWWIALPPTPAARTSSPTSMLFNFSVSEIFDAPCLCLHQTHNSNRKPWNFFLKSSFLSRDCLWLQSGRLICLFSHINVLPAHAWWRAWH